MNAIKKLYTVDEIKHLGYEIVAHMRKTGSVSWAVWDQYMLTENAIRYCEIIRHNPSLIPLF